MALAWLAYVERLVAIGELRSRTLESYKTGVTHRICSPTTATGASARSRPTISGVASHAASRRRVGLNDTRTLDGGQGRPCVRGAPRHDRRSPADKLLPRERPGAGEPRQRFLSREEMDALLSTPGTRMR